MLALVVACTPQERHRPNTCTLGALSLGQHRCWQESNSIAASVRPRRERRMPCVAFKARVLALTCTSGLTLPSSGPAFGGPLKSNVRPRCTSFKQVFVFQVISPRARSAEISVSSSLRELDGQMKAVPWQLRVSFGLRAGFKTSLSSASHPFIASPCRASRRLLGSARSNAKSKSSSRPASRPRSQAALPGFVGRPVFPCRGAA